VGPLPKIRVGKVRPSVVVGWWGRQDAALSPQKTTTWMLAFFASLQPKATGFGLLLPL